ncbi:MAG TPA: DUF423 domain-containing protein [Gammaproteobacteria bacterium]|nr:DUF423 domain-containing protein [Gammaproteobacteria bacterium]
MNNQTRFLLLFGAVNGLLYVALSAFAAHALKNSISPEQLAWFKTAAHYQGIHALALLASGILLQLFEKRGFYISGVLMLLGIVIFSGSLYAMALGAPRWFGAITPIGGVSLIAGWTFMIAGLLQKD